MKKILVVEDDEIMNAGICYHLQNTGLEAVSAFCLSAADDLLKQHTIDLVLLDVNLPDGNGFSFAKERMKFFEIPFIFLTAHTLEDEMIDGFTMGADDYITKPFSIRLVVQRILAVLRRYDTGNSSRLYNCGNLTVDFEARIVVKSGEQISLSPTEFKILQIFCNNQGIVLTRKLLLEKLWDNDGNFVDEQTLTINISRLRSKITDEQYSYIKTIYGMGYQWIGERDAK